MYFCRRAIVILAILVIETMLLPSHLMLQTNAQINTPVIVSIDVLGLAFINITGELIGSEYVPCIGEPLYIYSSSPQYLLSYLDLESRAILLISPLDDVINYTLIYVSLVSRPVGDNAWVTQLHLPLSTLIILPENSYIKQVTPLPRDILKINNRLALLMDKGDVTISYVLSSPQTITTTPFTSTSTPSIQPGDSLTTASSITTSILTTQTTTTEAAESKANYVLIIALVAIAFLVIFILLSRRRVNKTDHDIETYLDDRDKAIINYIKEKGSATPTEIMEATGIPKSAFYRRINRLEKLGIIEIIDLGTKKVYKIKDKS